LWRYDVDSGSKGTFLRRHLGWSGFAEWAVVSSGDPDQPWSPFGFCVLR